MIQCILRSLCILATIFISGNLEANGKRYYLSVCAIFQQEAQYLEEWIEYYKLLGVDHFYLYNNQSTDEWFEVLEPYIQSGLVEVKDWQTTDVLVRSITQLNAYNDILKKASKETKWLAYVDLDEFIVPISCHSLKQFLKKYEEFGGLIINWQIYGTSWIEKLSPGELLIDKLQYKGATDSPRNRYYKSIVQPAKVKYTESSHRFTYKKGWFAVDEDKIPYKPKWNTQMTETVKINKIRINHYWFKTEDFFYAVKLGRREVLEGRTKSKEEIWKLLIRYNEVYDPVIQKYVPALNTLLRHKREGHTL